MRRSFAASLALSALGLTLAIAGAVMARAEDSEAIAAGRDLAQKICTSCHVIGEDQPRAPILNPPAPAFADIAARPGVSEASLRHFLAEPHGESRRGSAMPPFMLHPLQVDAAVAYILSLKSKAPAGNDKYNMQDDQSSGPAAY